jgi:hypothetical protein
MVTSYRLMNPPRHLHRTIRPTVNRWAWLSFCTYLLLSGTAISGTPIEQDPNGFFGIQWGNPLANRNDLKEIDASNTLHVYTLKRGEPHVEGILMESVKLYGLDDQYARALFRYHGASTHKSLLQYLEAQFGKTNRSYGTMMRGLNQQYTWRGPETEITITYHGFRERGFLTAESRILAPLFLNVHGDHSF